MKSIISVKLKLIIFFILVALALLGAGYYYLNAMKTTQGKLNINKITKVNKLYSYDVYSDFYFRITKYNELGENVAEYSELQPVKTSIGYDLEKKNSKPILQSSLDEKICISENNADSLKKYTRMMRDFEGTFGKIVATQDKSYFESSYKSTQEILKGLYNIELKTQNSVDDYYTEIKDLPIANMKMKYFKLDKIPKNQREEMEVAPNKKGEWQPNILEWSFGEKDRIYLQYLTKWENNDLDDFVTKTAKNKTVIKLVKMNNNKLQTMYFMKYDKQNKLDTLFMDENGYVYILTFDATNPASFEKYISDYLKIVYGVYFEDVQHFENWFVEEGEAIKKEMSGDVVEGLLGGLICNNVLDNYLTDDILNYFNLVKYPIDIVTTDGNSYNCILNGEVIESDILIKTTKVSVEQYMNYYVGLFFQEENKMQKFVDNAGNKDILYEAIKHYDGFWTNGSTKIKELCSNGKIECIIKLKKNNWEE